MSSRSFNRKDFLVLTVTAVAASTLAACSDDPAAPGGTGGTGGGSGGSTGGGTGGSPAAGGSTSGAGGGSSGSASGGGGTGGSTAGGGGSGGSTAGGGGSGGSGGGVGGGGAGGGGGGGMCNADLMVTSSGMQHTHVLIIPAADITAGVTKTFETEEEGATHPHWVELTAADFTALKAGMEVKKTTCSGGDHEFVLKCGAGASAPVVPNDCNDECGGMENNTCP